MRMLRRNPCACHAKSTLNLKKWSETPVFQRFWLPNRARARAWCKCWRLQLPKVLRPCQFLTILTSKPLSRAGVVQILPTSTSKSAPTLSILTILTSKSLCSAGVVQISAASWAVDPPQPPFLGADFLSQRSHKTMEKHSISRNSYPPNPHVTHLCCITYLCCITHARSHLLVDRSSAQQLSV